MSKREQTRKWLRRYRFLKKEIAAREKHLQDFIIDLYSPLKAQTISDMPKSKNYINDTTANTVIKLNERMETQFISMMSDMQNIIDDLVIASCEIENAINSLSSHERCVLYHRFMLGTNWIDMPLYIDYDQRQCQRIENSAIDKIAKLIDGGKVEGKDVEISLCEKVLVIF